MVTDLRDLTGDPAGHAQQRIDTLTEWMDRAVTVGGTLGMTPADVRRFEDTELINEVVARYVAASPGSEDLAKTDQIVWRMYSGTAHGLRWSAMLRADIRPNPTGPATATSRTTRSNSTWPQARLPCSSDARSTCTRSVDTHTASCPLPTRTS
jgi:hypothetical protein